MKEVSDPKKTNGVQGEGENDNEVLGNFFREIGENGLYSDSIGWEKSMEEDYYDGSNILKED